MPADALHILIAEDELAHATAIRRSFQSSGMAVEFAVVSTLREFKASITLRPPDIALVDLNLPDGRASDILTHPPEAGQFPVLVMTSFGSEQLAVDAIKAGALDYVVKSPDAFAIMPRTVERALREWQVLQDRKRAETALLEANRKLERSLVLANELTRQAELADRSKSQFLSNISHELRTPLSGVIGMAALLDDTELNQTQREYNQLIKSCGQDLLVLINNLLRFAELEANKLRLEVSPFDLPTTMDDTIEMLSAPAREKGLALSCSIDPEVPSSLRGDPVMLRQIVLNLAGNAVKFTERGEVAIRITRDGGDEAHTMLRFVVRDTGIGIPQDRLELLFVPFSQVDGSSTRKYGGVGLGLSMARQLVEMMNGDVGVESQEGHGSTFWFTARFETA